MVSLAWIVRENDFEATVGSVYSWPSCPLYHSCVSHCMHTASQTVGNQHQIKCTTCAYNSVHLLWFHFLDKLCSPEGHSLVQCESNALEEQSVL